MIVPIREPKLESCTVRSPEYYPEKGKQNQHEQHPSQAKLLIQIFTFGIRGK